MPTSTRSSRQASDQYSVPTKLLQYPTTNPMWCDVRRLNRPTEAVPRSLHSVTVSDSLTTRMSTTDPHSIATTPAFFYLATKY